MNPKNFPPQTWEELVALRDFLSDCDVSFLRNDYDQKKYNSDLASESREEGILKITRKFGGKKIALVKNIYPHTKVLQNFPNALHYCLWSMKGPLSEIEIEKYVNEHFPDDEWTYMTRRDGYVSIPEIWHSHIYVNKK